ncbi:50S ribosomal protein L11 methyltransferase [Pontibacter qinzhouensis]|uniref:Ribosomal protein L11 methyltransferase n=1 Tax=Pontibacter qinzhouensis TaxID=2603253 RepID=A0A5C8JE09_9BACT|nr:50S ribosomal protein L11 methyltransferase [Pontibacter qinzhouensis]TXK36675.1 50S ribosomal protein L11 methyltransferase [Pontibacter qinzhouensis]
MDFIEVNLRVTPHFVDIFIAELGEIGFDAFVETDSGFCAYVTENLFDKTALDEMLQRYQGMVKVDYKVQKIERQNWNEEWERNFEPLFIAGQVSVRASFHERPEAATYDVIINPKMSFGTGHHETTTLMIENQLTLDHTGKRVLDMGCGTGILAIAAAQFGANDLVAVDIEDWTVENARENAELNNTTIDVRLGGAEQLEEEKPFDIVLANINRNVLLDDMPAYKAVLVPQGWLVLSGFYTEDLPIIKEKAASLGLVYTSHREKNNWVSAIFQSR